MLELLTVLAAVISAYYWIASAKVPIPNPLAYYDYTPDHDPFVVGFRKASSHNAKAAWASGATALLSAAVALKGVVQPNLPAYLAFLYL